MEAALVITECPSPAKNESRGDPRSCACHSFENLHFRRVEVRTDSKVSHRHQSRSHLNSGTVLPSPAVAPSCQIPCRGSLTLYSPKVRLVFYRTGISPALWPARRG